MQASVADMALRDVALPAVPGGTQVAPPESTAVLFMMTAGERTAAAGISVRPVAPDMAPVPIPGFGIPLFIIPIWPKPQDLIPGYYKGAPSMDFT